MDCYYKSFHLTSKIIQMEEWSEAQNPANTHTLTISASATIKGAVVGSLITAFVSWNSGKYNRIGAFIRRWRFIRYFVSPKKAHIKSMITQYHHPSLNTAANNFYCYAGQPGIGKSAHFKQLVASESTQRPGIYLCLKSTGREATFENDISEQLEYGEDGSNNGMISQIMRAVDTIGQINDRPQVIRARNLGVHLGFLATYYLLLTSSLDMIVQGVLAGVAGLAHFKYTQFMGPLLRQARRRTLPVVIFDDLQKLEPLGMLPEVARFLKLIEKKSVNMLLVSTDEEVWTRLIRQPGMKDRLRVRSIRYNHVETCQRMLEMLSQSPQEFKNKFAPHVLYNKEVLEKLLAQLIGVKQMSIRRFVSLLRLVDEQQYEKYTALLRNKEGLSVHEVVEEFTRVLFQRQMKSMVVVLKIIKRELPQLPDSNFVEHLDRLLAKRKLRSDDQVGRRLKIFNITREFRADYVINGTFTRTILEMAVHEYKAQLKEYEHT